MLKKILTTIVIIFIAGIAVAHEHWIDVSDFLPKLDEKIRVYITSGHSFPIGEIILGEKLLVDTKIVTPERREIVYSTKEDKKGVQRLSEEMALTVTGIYLAQFNLKKPQAKEPNYYAKSIISAGEITVDKEFNPVSYTLGDYLEIIPLKLLKNLKRGDELPLKVVMDNKPLKDTLDVSVKLPVRTDSSSGVSPDKDEKKPVSAEQNFTLKSDKEGIARLKISYPGKYLIVMNHKGIGASLTFYIASFKEDKEK
jgi:hypothetical protein